MLTMARNTTAEPTPSAEEALTPVEALGVNQLVLRDRMLFEEGEEAAYAYKILSGVVRTYKIMPDGRRYVTDFLMAGDLVAFDSGDRHMVAAEAVVDCVIRRYPRRQVERAANDNPAVARRLLTLAWDRLAAAQSHMAALVRMTAEERLASFLMALVDRGGAERKVGLPMARTDIADHLGLTLETVSRLLSRLRKDGVINLPDVHSFVVVDLEALRARCFVAEAA
jgi:CRP-like cAMP-binding protein